MFRAAAVGVCCLLAGCASTPKQDSATMAAQPTASIPAAPGAVALHVRGMGCPLCATNVKKSLERVPGVEKVDIDLGGGVVKVSARANLVPEETALRKAVADAGFECAQVERL